LTTAIAAGAPVVASTIRGLQGYIEGTAVGVPPGDVIALREAVSYLLSHPAVAKSTSLAARTAAERRTRQQYFADLRRKLLELD
jgi:glycosyltransferase involved in cell wall biosynthesis